MNEILKDFEFVELNFENCEVIKIKVDNFNEINLSGITREYDFNNYHGETLCHETIHANEIYLWLKEDSVGYNYLEQKEMLVKERITKFKDLVSITLENKNERQEIYCPWKSLEGSHEQINELMKLTIKKGIIFVEVHK